MFTLVLSSVLVVLGLVILWTAIKWIRTPKATEEEIMEFLQSPNWKSAGEVRNEFREQKKLRFISSTVLHYRIQILLMALAGKQKLGIKEIKAEQNFRIIFWDSLRGKVHSMDKYVTPERQKYNVWVLWPNFEPELQGFVGHVGGELIISSDVPEKDRPLYYRHEVLCRVLYKGCEGSCLMATEGELVMVWSMGNEFARGYIVRRLLFFDRLIRYHTERKASAEFLEQLVASRTRLAQEVAIYSL